MNRFEFDLNYGDTFILLLLDPKDKLIWSDKMTLESASELLQDKLVYLYGVSSVLYKYQTLLETISKTKLLNLKNNIEKIKEDLFSFLYLISEKDIKTNFIFNNELATENLNIIFDTFNNTINYYYLEKTMKKQSTISVKHKI